MDCCSEITHPITCNIKAGRLALHESKLFQNICVTKRSNVHSKLTISLKDLTSNSVLAIKLCSSKI